MLDKLHSYMPVVCTYQCRDVFKNIFWCGCCSLLIFIAEKATKGTELPFLCTQGTLQGGRVEDHRMMSTRHLHLPQSYIQAILYIYKTDYIMSLTLYTLTSVCMSVVCTYHCRGVFKNIVWYGCCSLLIFHWKN